MRSSLEPFYVECETEIHLLGRYPSLFVGIYSRERQLDPGVVFSDVVSSIHQIVGHDVEKVQRCADCRNGGLGESQHVSREARYSGRDKLGRAQGGANLREQQWIGFDFPSPFGIGDLLVVFAVSSVTVSVLH